MKQPRLFNNPNNPSWLESFNWKNGRACVAGMQTIEWFNLKEDGYDEREIMTRSTPMPPTRWRNDQLFMLADLIESYNHQMAVNLMGTADYVPQAYERALNNTSIFD